MRSLLPGMMDLGLPDQGDQTLGAVGARIQARVTDEEGDGLHPVGVLVREGRDQQLLEGRADLVGQVELTQLVDRDLALAHRGRQQGPASAPTVEGDRRLGAAAGHHPAPSVAGEPVEGAAAVLDEQFAPIALLAVGESLEMIGDQGEFVAGEPRRSVAGDGDEQDQEERERGTVLAVRHPGHPFRRRSRPGRVYRRRSARRSAARAG